MISERRSFGRPSTRCPGRIPSGHGSDTARCSANHAVRPGRHTNTSFGLYYDMDWLSLKYDVFIFWNSFVILKQQEKDSLLFILPEERRAEINQSHNTAHVLFVTPLIFTVHFVFAKYRLWWINSSFIRTIEWQITDYLARRGFRIKIEIYELHPFPGSSTIMYGQSSASW